MDAATSALRALDVLVARLEGACASEDREGLKQAIAALRDELRRVDGQMAGARLGTEKVARNQADALAQSVVIAAELTEAKAALEREVLERKRAVAEVRQLNAELEQRVNVRTEALRRTNEALQKEVAVRRVAEDRLRHDALHDSLTSLPNRQLLLDRLSRSIERQRRHAEHLFAVLFLDIDNFKVINDSLGHRFGDGVLVEITKRLTSALRTLDSVSRGEDDTTARLGGDEFVILLDGFERTSDALLIADRVQRRLAEPLKLGQQELFVTASIGIALSEGGTKSPEELLRDADTAMYRAKQAGKARHAVFDETMHVQAQARLRLENDLRTALDRGELNLVYQPIMDLQTGQIQSFEGLLRWTHAEHGVVSPDEFVPVAEEVGLIVPLGRWAMTQACCWLSKWKNRLAAERPLQINVNVSKRQLVEPGFVHEVRKALADAGIESEDLNLEITESAIIGASEIVSKTLADLKALGVQVHMDDFGTGYSSLSCLHEFPIDVLKIDKAFVMNMQDNTRYAAVVNTIISLARHLNLKVTAEGVETEEQLRLLEAAGCDYAQGYYFSRPVDGETAAELLTRDACLVAAG